MTLNCKGTLMDISEPIVMGVLNITPDSYYSKSASLHLETILKRIETLDQEGAKIIDVGTYSSRPNATKVTEQEELKRLTNSIKEIIKTFPDVIFSIDTFRSEVAKVAIDEGFAIVNDISAGALDPLMLKTVSELQVPYIMMHMRGTPQTMMDDTHYDNFHKDIVFYFSKKINEAKQLGINDLIIDPGFGFSKTLEQNYDLMNHLEIFSSLETPLLVGISRKSMIFKLLNGSAETALNGTTALHMIALQKGAKILRVHDVKEAIECIQIHNQLNKA